MDSPILSLSATALLGLTMGFTACSAFCLPYFGSWVLGRDRATPWQDAGLFLLGRVVAYALLGGLAAGLGQVLLLQTATGASRFILAGVSLLAGFFLLFFPVSPSHGRCQVGQSAAHWPPLLLGMAVSLVPCPPLAALLGACALTGEVGVGLGHGVIFGLCASLAPIGLASVVLGRTGRALVEIFPACSQWLRRGAGLVLIALALRPVM